MKCKHCKLEVHYEGGYLEEEGTGSKQCFANKIKTAGQSFHGHEPVEPEETPAIPQNQIPPAYCEEHDKVHKCELVADNGPRVDTRRVLLQLQNLSNLPPEQMTAHSGTVSSGMLRYLDEMKPSIEQPAVEPQNTSKLRAKIYELIPSSPGDLMFRLTAIGFLEHEVKEELARLLLAGGPLELTNDHIICKRAGSTRPEMPPDWITSATRRIDLLALRGIYGSHEIEKIIREEAASVQLSAQEIWNRLPAIHIEQEGEVALIQRVLDLLKSQPPAPRTEGQESVIGMYLSLERYNELIGRENVLLASEHKNVLLLAADIEDELHEIARLIGTDDRSNVINAVKNSLAQVRTQSAPRTTLPDHYKFADEWVGKHYVHKYPTQVISDIPVMDAVQMLADFVQQFFAAIPEATKNRK